jgi:hypothetical protein
MASAADGRDRSDGKRKEDRNLAPIHPISYTYGGYNPYPPYNNYPSIGNTDKYTSAALVLNIGREFFLGGHITFDISGGLGHGGEWRNGEWADSYNYNSHNGYHAYRQDYAFTHAFLGDTSPLVISGGLRFGYVF